MMLCLLLILASLTQAVPHEKMVEHRSLSSVYTVVDGPITWYDAKAKCEAMGCTLAQPKSEQENNAIQAILPGGGFFWLGITDLNHEGRFTYYTDDQDIVYNNWKLGQPNNFDNIQHCVDMNFNSEWNDYICDDTDTGAICECPPPPPPPPPGASGDPHIRTFDSRAYTFQGTGWYILFKDCTNKPRFEVTAKFEPREDSTPDQVRTKIIAFNVTVGNQYAIVNGLDVTTGSTGGQVTDAKVITIQEEDKHIKLHFTSKDTTFTFNWTLRKHVLDVSYNGSFYKGSYAV
ncbi:uncharacterized protein LOC100367877 [Saccoglossus kowalevskii]|uniref:Uncharacterized protein LOC100367877 n=1 Tax=Saccoglossus kowalevskii TaxID=10224 RepID=A0ABM0GR15_SACKO|nr:PREDICTED: uncharacterized protein LOC100367877 [Saccoglossus kowalevskii]